MNTTYYNQAINTTAYEVLEEQEHLQLIHYPTKWGKVTDPKEDWWVRGLVIDNRIDRVVATSYGYTGEVQDDLPEDMTYFKGHEGALIRVYLNDGKVRVSSHRRISIDKSRWGSSMTFLEMIESDPTSAATLKRLFEEGKKESPHCYLFLLRHPELMCCSLEKVNKTILTYLDSTTSYTKEDGLFPEETVEWTKAAMLPPKPISREQALKHLKVGYGSRFEDNSILSGGEFVIASTKDELGRTRLTKVTSAAYRWRASIVDNNPNMSQRLCQLISYSRGAKNELQLPELTRNQVKSIKLKCIPSSNKKLGYLSLTLYSSVSWYWLALPLNLRSNLEEVASNYLTQVNLLIEFILSLEGQELPPKTPDRVKEILECAKKYGKGDTRSRVKFLISKEYGTSLYKLIKYRMSLEE